jgi:hypothetical protein
MKDQQLADLNFKDLLHYGGQPPVRYRYDHLLQCTGYCIACDEKYDDVKLDLMSHGADSSDFEQILGPMPPVVSGRSIVAQPVLFLLEQPGGDDYGIGKKIPFRGFTKEPPVQHYYWSPSGSKWPEKIDDFNGNFYGPYFAYIMAKHALGNVYITNLFKCRIAKDEMRRKVEAKCHTRYLSKELAIFRPAVVFCFGREAEHGFGRVTQLNERKIRSIYLFHPRAVRDARMYGKDRQAMIDENDRRIESALSSLE